MILSKITQNDQFMKMLKTTEIILHFYFILLKTNSCNCIWKVKNGWMANKQKMKQKTGIPCILLNIVIVIAIWIQKKKRGKKSENMLHAWVHPCQGGIFGLGF